MCGQPVSQLQRQGLHALAPRSLPVGEDIVVDLPEQPLDQGPDDRRLVREVGVDGVRGDTDPCRDAPHARRMRPAVVEKAQRRIEDLVFGECTPWTGTAPYRWRGHWC